MAIRPAATKPAPSFFKYAMIIYSVFMDKTWISFVRKYVTKTVKELKNGARKTQVSFMLIVTFRMFKTRWKTALVTIRP
jgi:hypothetical protein